MLEDPELKSQLMELEALRQSKIPKSEGANKPYIKPLEESFVMVDQDKHKEVILHLHVVFENLLIS